ncbi:transposable element Tc1 transposase [Trichonephila clavipes]|nr:transposable element Tc1 transposase [Trichonephila clavipes]
MRTKANILPCRTVPADENFLWNDIDEKISLKYSDVYRFNLVNFGVSSSPFLLAATIRHHIEKYKHEFPHTVELLDRNFYVDDLISGGNEFEEALQTSRRAKNIIEAAGMDLRKWITNDANLMEQWKKEIFNVHPVHETVSLGANGTKAGYHGRVAHKKPHISAVNRQKGLDFANEHVNKPPQFWEKVLFSNESKFCIFGIKGRKLVWRKQGTALEKENLVPTVKHGGGGVMVWGCMAANGVGRLNFIDSTLNHMGYINILKENLKQGEQDLNLGDDFWFQQDNDPKHNAHNVKLWLLYNIKNQLRSPPQSPDLNPSEHLWDLLERKIGQHPITSK